MKIVVLGAGVIGVSSAWYLAKAGHEVTVIDRQSGAAGETSYGNAGMISPGYSSPWAGPGIPMKAIGWMLQDLAPFLINLKELDAHTIGWMAKMFANCNKRSYQLNKRRMLRVAEYSKRCFSELRQELDIDYEGRQLGTLQLFRKHKQIEDAEKDVEVLKQFGVNFESLDQSGCVKYEPALANVREKFVGGIHLPDDETGDCFKFTNALADECRKAGVIFQFDTVIDQFVVKNKRIVGIEVRQEASSERAVEMTSNKQAGEHTTVTGDCFLVALGSYTPKLLKPVGIEVPIYPIKGYSLTIPIGDESHAPLSTVMDETYKVAVTRFANRIRVGGIAEITSYNLSRLEKRRAAVDFVVSDLFPGACDIKQAEFWTGLRAMTPESTPVLGETRYPNLFLNSGHGTLGWTMSLGSAKYVSDLISHIKPEIDTEGLSVKRYD